MCVVHIIYLEQQNVMSILQIDSILSISRHKMSKRKAEEDVRRGDLLVGSSLLDRYKRLKTNHDTDNYNQNVKLSNLCPDAPPFVSSSVCQDDVEKENKTDVDWRRTIVCKYKLQTHCTTLLLIYNHHEHLQVLH